MADNCSRFFIGLDTLPAMSATVSKHWLWLNAQLQGTGSRTECLYEES